MVSVRASYNVFIKITECRFIVATSRDATRNMVDVICTHARYGLEVEVFDMLELSICI